MKAMKKIYDKYRNLRSRAVISRYRLIYGKRFSAGKGLYARKDFVVTVEEEGYVKIGKDVFFNNYCSLNALCGIEIGDNCIFGENVRIYDHNHKYENPDVPINSQGFKKAKIVIGNNCWIGSNVTILKGSYVGDHCVIGTGCIIHGNIPPNSKVICSNEQPVETITQI